MLAAPWPALAANRIALIQSALSKNVELVIDLADNLPPIEADALQLEQLVLNLEVNLNLPASSQQSFS